MSVKWPAPRHPPFRSCSLTFQSQRVSQSPHVESRDQSPHFLKAPVTVVQLAVTFRIAGRLPSGATVPAWPGPAQPLPSAGRPAQPGAPWASAHQACLCSEPCARSPHLAGGVLSSPAIPSPPVGHGTWDGPGPPVGAPPRFPGAGPEMPGGEACPLPAPQDELLLSLRTPGTSQPRLLEGFSTSLPEQCFQ